MRRSPPVRSQPPTKRRAHLAPGASPALLLQHLRHARRRAPIPHRRARLPRRGPLGIGSRGRELRFDGVVELGFGGDEGAGRHVQVVQGGGAAGGLAGTVEVVLDYVELFGGVKGGRVGVG